MRGPDAFQDVLGIILGNILAAEEDAYTVWIALGFKYRQTKLRFGVDKA